MWIAYLCLGRLPACLQGMRLCPILIGRSLYKWIITKRPLQLNIKPKIPPFPHIPPLIFGAFLSSGSFVSSPGLRTKRLFSSSYSNLRMPIDIISTLPSHDQSSSLVTLTTAPPLLNCPAKCCICMLRSSGPHATPGAKT